MGKYLKVESVEREFLIEEEVEVIEEVLNEVISQLLVPYGTAPQKGSFIIDCQRYGEAARCEMRGTFTEGVYHHDFYGAYKRSSDEIAAESINQLLCWPKESSRYQRHFEKCDLLQIKNQMYPTSGIYRDGELLVMVLNADEGRVIAGVTGETTDGQDLTEECKLLLQVIGETIVQLESEDKTLLRAIDAITNEKGRAALELVENLFVETKLPAIQKWQTWKLE